MFFTKTQHTRMSTHPHLAFLYFNGAKSPLQFSVSKDIPLVDLKSKLDALHQYAENQRVFKLEYRSSLIDDEENIWFNKLELKTNEDLKITWNIFYRHASKCLIELDATIARSTKDSLKMFQRPEPLIWNEI